MQPDSLIIAIGAKEIKPPIPGIDAKHVCMACDAIEHIDELQDEIVIIGGGTIGSELALELSLIKNKKVTIVEMGNELAAQANSLYKIALNQKIAVDHHLDIYLNSCCKKIKTNSVMIQTEKDIIEIPAKQVIIATGLQSKTEEAYAYYGITPETIMVGDCNTPRIIMDAVYEGYSAGINL